MQVAGYEIAIGIWDIISLLLPIGVIFVFYDFKRRHKTRMARLDLLYGATTEQGNSNAPAKEQGSKAGEELLEKLVDEQIE